MNSNREDTFFRRSKRIKTLLVLVLVLLIVLMFPRGESLESEVPVGSIWIQEDLIAGFTYPIYKDPELYKKETEDAAEKVLPVFIVDTRAKKQALDSLQRFQKALMEKLEREIRDTSSKSRRFAFLKESTYRFLRDVRNLRSNFARSRSNPIKEIFDAAPGLLTRVYDSGIINIDQSDIEKDSIAIREGRFEYQENKQTYRDTTSARDYIVNYINANFSQRAALNEAAIEIISHFVHPNIIYREDLTEEEINRAKDRIARNIGIVNENERIIAKHERVTPEAKLKIDSYKIAKGETSETVNIVLQYIGKLLHILIIISLFSIYIFLFRKKIYYDNLKILLICIVVLFITFITFLVYRMDINVPLEMMIMVPAASMLFTIIFDSRVGFYGTVAVALIAGALRGNDYSFALTHIFAGAIAAYTVRDIKNRTQIFRSLLYILLAYLGAIVAFGLERFEEPQAMLIEFAFAASNALISPVFTFGLLIFFERLFKITTDLTLLELTDFNRPLLKELARNAPGTFTHSMTIGTLVETAAEHIGANPLLARVGAYYHDIGKTITPSSFVENQLNNENIHENLDPKESARLIINHVQSGVELARKHQLPEELVEFIPMHHGTTVVSYFYEKSKEKYGEANVNLDDFRYPGPKPNTKETALVMLADACESAVRSITDPEPAKVENIINNLIKSRIDDKQLDESPLTLSDIEKIKKTYVNILIGQRHKRIRYPKQDELENESPSAEVKNG
jgi:putative nucleotidyltransferase with HDIG domain